MNLKFYRSNKEQLPFVNREEASYWKVGDIWGIKDFSSREELHFLESMHGYFVFQELDLLEQEWGAIWKRDLILTEEANPLYLGHLINSLSLTKIPAENRPLPAVQNLFEELGNSINNELIFALAEMLKPELIDAINLVKVDDTKDYTHLAHLKDLLTEIQSLLLKQRLAELRALKLELLKGQAHIEKEIAKVRFRLSENSASLVSILQKIVDQRGDGFQVKCELLLACLQPRDSWLEREIVWGLLLNRFNTSIITVGKWSDKIGLQAAFLSSLKQYVEQEGDEQILNYLRKKVNTLPEKLLNKVKEQLLEWNLSHIITFL